MKKGFDRLRGMAAASAIGIAGLAGGGSARAATVSTPVSVTPAAGVFWTWIGNTTIGTFSTPGGLVVNDSISGFGISDASLSNGTTTWSDFYDGGMMFAAGNVLFENPDATVDLTGNTLTTDTVVDIIPGVDAQLEYYFDPARHVVRGLFTLTNTTPAAITTSAHVLGNYGSDGSTTVQATSNGDLVVDDTDLWVVSNDSGVVGDDACTGCDPTATLATHGSGAGVVPTTVLTLESGDWDYYGYRYAVTIPANGKVRILVFNEMTTTIADAVTGAADFESLTAAGAAGLLTGIDAAAQAEIVNYAAGGGVVVAADDDDDDGLFALGMPGLLGMLGSLLLFRQRGRKDRR